NIKIIQAQKSYNYDFVLRFYNGVIYTISKNGQIFNTSLFEESNVKFGLGDMDSFFEDSADEFNFFKLMRYIQENKANLKKSLEIEYKINLFDKIALPITTLALSLIGIPLAITPPRVRYNRGFLFSILIIFVYYVIRALSMNLGESERLTPFLAAWLPIIVITIVGLYLFNRKVYKI
ncbi:LptF/LptG family permease, partial [bacterium]|nr:LptF/LptG family permease [bacterium]